MPVVVSFVGSDILVKEYGYFVKSVFFWGGGAWARDIFRSKKFIDSMDFRKDKFFTGMIQSSGYNTGMISCKLFSDTMLPHSSHYANRPSTCLFLSCMNFRCWLHNGLVFWHQRHGFLLTNNWRERWVVSQTNFMLWLTWRHQIWFDKEQISLEQKLHLTIIICCQWQRTNTQIPLSHLIWERQLVNQFVQIISDLPKYS
jgi:hypothetical protein